MPVDFAAADVFGEVRVKFGEMTRTRAGWKTTGSFAWRGAATDDDDQTVFEFQEAEKGSWDDPFGRREVGGEETSWWKFCQSLTARRLECAGAPVAMTS
jgi:hypothetical protein